MNRFQSSLCKSPSVTSIKSKVRFVLKEFFQQFHANRSNKKKLLKISKDSSGTEFDSLSFLNFVQRQKKDFSYKLDFAKQFLRIFDK
ncbi:hypothetical protein BpHYR1_041776 [Brachionus plicatilis]|uniref:Uncharacterized protein n=1 Tax=Brachionus plicatilis TaxID=10195 RepID=A0A3M7PQC1_BRAPC|nr:hypothetical protein BpHYR1_041776 [Brachionus plicatilis]